MNREDVIEFFDELAPQWDADMIRNDRIINEILDRGNVVQGSRVLDVACGTGVLFPDYLKRNVLSVKGVDISPKMASIASEKAKDTQISVICSDVNELEFEEEFDCIMIYNAFPHFPSPYKLFEHLATALKKNGRITIAHSMSRKSIDAHHKGHANKVSIGLMHEDELADMMSRWFEVDTKISDDEKYIVSGVLIDSKRDL